MCRLKKDPCQNTQEAHRTPNRKDHKKLSRHIIAKTSNIHNKETRWKAARRNYKSCKGKPIRIAFDLSMKTFKS